MSTTSPPSTQQQNWNLGLFLCCAFSLYSIRNYVNYDFFMVTKITETNAVAINQDVPLAVWDAAEKSSESFHTRHNYGPSQLISEVVKISHLPFERKVVVHLVSNNTSNEPRNCVNPRFFGRLSGPYVTLIEWESTKISPGNGQARTRAHDFDETVGAYSVPAPGRYFVEVIGLFCNNLQWNERFEETCLEDPRTHRITAEDAYIDVVHAIPKDSSELFGYWEWTTAEKTHEPLHTRYQPHDCRHPKSHNIPRCRIPTSRDRFTPYEFQFAGRNNNTYQDIWTRFKHENQRLSSDKAHVLCFVGASHSRELASEVNSWLQQIRNISAGSVKALHIDAGFPWLVDPTALLENDCSISIVATGQWPAARKPPTTIYRDEPLTGFLEFQQQTSDMIDRLLLEGVPNVVLRSIHYNALGDLKTTCPPQDWRSPPVIETYNDIIQDLVRGRSDENLSYLDTTIVSGPLWDIQKDYSHFRNDKVARAEALYVLYRLQNMLYN